jgi:hypothetical protein
MSAPVTTSVVEETPMRRHLKMKITLALVTLLGFEQASAAPILSIDAAPGLAGTQTLGTTGLGDVFRIDVLASDIDAATPLNAFEFDLLFDPTVLVPIAVEIGGLLSSPVVIVQSELGQTAVAFAAATLGAAGASGAGLLASVSFQSAALGTSPLRLEEVLLSAPFGVRIGADRVDSAAVRVVPEPSTALLIGAGLILAARAQRREASACKIRPARALRSDLRWNS